MNELIIKSGDGEYPVHFFDSLEAVLHQLESIQNTYFIVDRKVYHLYPQLVQYLTNKTFLLLDATEEEKSWEGTGKVLKWYQENNITKANHIVAIGGGIIQDITCFSASVYYRGLSWSFVPTTVLSMSDSCIGAKCAVNFNGYKNQVGTFHSPKSVYICSEFATTLEQKDILSGYGEILKLAITGNKDLYLKLVQDLASEDLRGKILNDLIKATLAVKKSIIEIDEYETNLRRILNYGHTLGHSLESLSDYAVPHGLAVAWGMDIINFISWKRGHLSETHFREIHGLIKKYFSFSLEKMISAEALLNGARRDKKASGNAVNLILLSDFGKLEIVKINFDQDLTNQVETYLKEYNLYAN